MSAERNMYDCTPCPRCGERFRAAYGPTHPRHPESVACDDCGHIEPKDGENHKPHGSDEDA